MVTTERFACPAFVLQFIDAVERLKAPLSHEDCSDDRRVKRSGFGRVARRMTRWTSNLLATAVVVAVGLVLARQMVHWDAREAPEQGAVPSSTSWRNAPFSLEFGDGRYALRRRNVDGDKQTAVSQARRLCREVLSSGAAVFGRPDAAEQRLLRQISLMTPVERFSDGELFEFDAGPFPLIVAVRPADGARETDGEEVVLSPVRMVAWGMAVPAGPRRWSVYVYQHAHGGGSVDRSENEIPLPPGGRRTLAIRSADGGAMIGFKGAGPLARWREFFDAWLARNDISPDHPWRAVDANWRLRFTTAASEHPVQVDVQIGPSQDGSPAGFMTITPSPAPTSER